MNATSHADLGKELQSILALQHPPMAIRFSATPPEGVPRFDAPVPEPTADGRTGRVAAGCVFWMHGSERTFTTLPEDHGNCSVGSLTHGLLSLSEAAGRADVAALVAAEWVSPEAFPGIPTVSERPGAITYGPLGECDDEPDVVFLRINGKQAMILADALPDLHYEGKPQCHIIPMAREQGAVALSVGCMLSRVRTGMGNSEMTCAIPGPRLAEVVERLRATRVADNAVAAYAAEDARRFAG